MAKTEKDEFIDVISKASDRYGNRLIEFLERYNLSGLIEANIEQFKEYIADEAIERRQKWTTK